jgi:hypothetical protein
MRDGIIGMMATGTVVLPGFSGEGRIAKGE